MFGDRLSKLRELQGLSQKELAKKANVSLSTIQRYETNERKPDSDIVVQLAIVLGTTTDYLLGMPNAQTLGYYHLNKTQFAILKEVADFFNQQLIENQNHLEIETIK